MDRPTRFSRRTAWNLEESDLARAHRQRVQSGFPLADLTASNPTRCGFRYAPDLLSALGDPASLIYDPDPKGSAFARSAVSRYYQDQGTQVDPGKIVLTTSTSEAYGYIFKLLCNPGDAILAVQPSYPLFDFLAAAEVVQIDAAPLIYDHGWQLDFVSLRQKITPRTRAIVLVHPNNPTGHFTRPEEAHELAAICREHGMALIVDEVFLDYPIAVHPAGLPRTLAHLDLDALVFIVSGISKICGLPQMKSGWLATLGPESDEALSRLEVLADTYLSMNMPVQRALPIWLADRFNIQQQIRERVAGNLAALDRALTSAAGTENSSGWVNRLEVEGGWYAVLRVPATQPDEETTLALLALGVWVHPGYFFGFASSGWLVVSLLTPPEEFSTGISILLQYFDQNNGSSGLGSH